MLLHFYTYRTKVVKRLIASDRISCHYTHTIASAATTPPTAHSPWATKYKSTTVEMRGMCESISGQIYVPTLY